MWLLSTWRQLRKDFLKCLAGGPAYLDRAAPVFAPAKFRVLGFSTGPLIELDRGSNCPGRIIGPGRSAATWRFLIFCAALAFARWRALALVMSVPSF